MVGLLARYEAKARGMSIPELEFAIKDIKDCWATNADWQDPTHPYGERLWAEWDAYIVELNLREKQT